MGVLAVRTLHEFWENHFDAEHPLRAWYKEVATANCHASQILETRFPSGDILPGN